MGSRFKPVMQHQPMLLPPDISELIPPGAMVRVVDGMVDLLDRELIDSLCPGGGSPAYDPVMLLKVVLFSYAQGVYSSRKIAKATSQDLHVMWLCGMTPLSHNTISRFRSARIQPVFEAIFAEMVHMLAEAGYVDLSTYFLDGTKIEANANKYTFVWAKNTTRYTGNLQDKIRDHLSAIDELNDEEEVLAPEDPRSIDSSELERIAKKVNERLCQRPKDPALKKTARLLEGEWAHKLSTYETQARIAGDRGSYAKTDTDASFMRMKEDHMGNGQLKAAYNIQVGTWGQFIIDATVHNRPGDTACAIEHLDHVKTQLGRLPRTVVADAGYGSQQNYKYLEDQGVTAVVKHNDFFRESKNKAWREDPFRVANWPHNPEDDTYTCPAGAKLYFSHNTTGVSDLGYSTTSRVYKSPSCKDCPLRSKCFKSKTPEAVKTIRINTENARYREQASTLLHHPSGALLRKRRSIEVETVFGDIKANHHFTRFTLRGKQKTSLEFQWIAMGHNIRKIHHTEAKNRS